ncbi:MAG TPA: ABC transporter permease [Bryobacteraceae bacterium]|jgi:putative ABC transport system permease protein|nr:ABC transporter permease [Bryobacteraceae bacterium]
MLHARRLFAKLRNLFRRVSADRDLDREVSAHLTLLEDEFRRRGMSPEDARFEARRAYGGVEQAKQLHREERSILWLEQTLQDLRYAYRNLLKTPGFTSIAVLTLALGIGANIAIFAVVNAVLLQPLPFQHPEQLVRVFDDLNGSGAQDVGMSVPELQDLRDRSGAFDRISAIWAVSNALSGGDHAERIEMLGTGFDYFHILGVNAALGRVYGSQDAVPGYSESAVISDGLWKRQFGGDPHILGRRIRMDEDGYTIVGVMPPEFRHPGQTLAGDVEVWLAAGLAADPMPMPPVRAQRLGIRAIARLKPGLTIQQAQQRLDALVAQLTEIYPKEYPAAARWSLRLAPVQESLTGSVRPTLIVLFAAVGFVLLMVAVNMANLLVARSSGRIRELAIRQALGASRARLIRQLLTESTLISLAGGLAAILVLALTKTSLLALMPADLPRLTEVHFDARVIGLACALSLLTGILFGLTPALHASRTDPNLDLKEGTRGGTPSARQNRFRGALVAAEVALSVVLLSGAGILLHSFWNALRVNPGFDPNGLLVTRIWIPVPNNPKANRYLTAPPLATFSREVLRQVRMLPGVQAAAMGGENSVPFVRNFSSLDAFSLPDQPDSVQKQPSAEFASVSPEFFRVVRTPLLRGRFFTEADTDKTKPVVLVNEAFAKRYLSGPDVGKRMNYAGKDSQIVGVVGDVRDDGLDTPVAPRFYRSLYQDAGSNELAVFLRSADSAGLRQAVTRIVHGVDAELPVYGVRSMPEMMAASLARRRFSLSLMAVFGALALFLASIGIYGVMAYAVSQRAQEFSIRMALGAEARDILLLALRPGVILTLTGVALGLAAAQGATRLMASLLFGVSPADPITFVGVPIALAFVALLACWIPARRAVRIPPVSALRS